MANLHFFYGTMVAGKSAKLLQDRYNFIQKNATVWVIKPRTDRTSEPKITSRIGLECPAEIMDNIRWQDIILRKEFYSDVIMLDEIQFFKPKDIDSLVKLADTYNRLIFCYGLMSDVNEKLFPASKHLIEVGAKLHEIPCSCQMVGCKNLANHHLRYHKMGYVIKDGKSVVVDDGQVVYKSVCRRCYDQEMQKHR